MDKVLREQIEHRALHWAQWRQHLHQHPELSDGEQQTAAFVSEKLGALANVVVETGVGGHGVVATIHGAQGGKTVALRADMDALPIREESDKAYCSRNPGVMHACGHDGHTAILLGAVEILAARTEEIHGTVRCLFQPAEENAGGAKRLCEAGVMTTVDAVFCLHGWPALAVGQIGIRPGAITASADKFEITIQGRGAHGAYPHLAIDPVVAAAHTVLVLQTLASRETDPVEPLVVTVGEIHGGAASNVIPETVRLAGTIRTHSHAVRAAIFAKIERVAKHTCEALGAQATVMFTQGTPPVVNDAKLTGLLGAVGATVVGADNVVLLPHASMGAEDFSFYLEHAPGALFRLGLGDPTPLHTPGFDFNDVAIPVGVEMLCQTALRFLESEAGRDLP